MGKIEDVIAELHLQEKKNIQAMADKHGVNQSTLLKQFNGKTGSKVNGYNLPSLHPPYLRGTRTAASRGPSPEPDDRYQN